MYLVHATCAASLLPGNGTTGIKDYAMRTSSDDIAYSIGIDGIFTLSTNYINILYTDVQTVPGTVILHFELGVTKSYIF
jgi:hypothetical protein